MSITTTIPPQETSPRKTRASTTDLKEEENDDQLQKQQPSLGQGSLPLSQDTDDVPHSPISDPKATQKHITVTEHHGDGAGTDC